MKVLMTSDSYLPRIGGAEIHVSNLISQLRLKGNDVYLITTEKGEAEENLFRLKWSLINSFRLLYEIWIQSKDVDVIHSHYCHRLAFLASVVGILRRKSVVITLHGYGILNPTTKKKRAQLTHAFYRYVSLKLCTKVISTSQDLADVAYKYIPSTKVTVIYNGYDNSIFNPNDSYPRPSNLPDRKILLTVRRLVPKNGIQYLVEALPRVLKKYPNVYLAIIGDGPLKEEIASRIDELGIGSSVCLLGRKQNFEVVHYIHHSDLVIFPSTAESASIACVEAMAMGAPVLASKVGGLVELIGAHEERGYLVELMNWVGSNYDAPKELSSEKLDTFAEKIISVIENKDQAKLKASQAQEYTKQKFTWESITERTLELYRKYI